MTLAFKVRRFSRLSAIMSSIFARFAAIASCLAWGIESKRKGGVNNRRKSKRTAERRMVRKAIDSISTPSYRCGLSLSCLWPLGLRGFTSLRGSSNSHVLPCRSASFLSRAAFLADKGALYHTPFTRRGFKASFPSFARRCAM
jgi:hypothetical protein